MKASSNLKFTIIAVFLLAAVGLFALIKKAPSASVIREAASQTEPPIIYDNEQYAFHFTLPGDWKGFSIVDDEWLGTVSTVKSDTTVEKGPLVRIRHPQWTVATPHQDVPIMIFTAKQWTDLQKGKYQLGAAPVGPTELGRNEKYIFALPAHYNFAFPVGYEEVNDIIKGKPFHAT